MEHPDVTPGAQDAATLVKADLGIVGRIRLRIASPVFLLAILILPPEVREAFSDLTISDD